MLSRPRKPPAKRCLPAHVLAVHPPGEVEQQLVEDAREEERGRAAPRRAGHLVDPPAGPGVDRRVDVVEGELVGRQLAVGVHVPLAQEAGPAAPWRTRGSIRASGIMWKARSQAAYQGYSHLSGIEMTSRLNRWRQSWLRPCVRLRGGGGWPGSPSSQSLTT